MDDHEEAAANQRHHHQQQQKAFSSQHSNSPASFFAAARARAERWCPSTVAIVDVEEETADGANTSAENQQQPATDFYRCETNRLNTFDNWPLPFVDKRKLAAAGLYYTNEGDTVKCPYCRVKISQWTAADHPFISHRHHSPHCPFVIRNKNLFGKMDCFCTPTSPPESEPAQDTAGETGTCPCKEPSSYLPPGKDEVGPYKNIPNESAAIQIERQARDNFLDTFNINTSENPKYPHYTTYERRLNTFAKWPATSKVMPDVLSLAGFLYSSPDDVGRTICFHCGGTLLNWADEDEPWVEHAHWFPRCQYVLKMRGQQFIEQARTMKHEALVTQTNSVVKSALDMAELLSENKSDKDTGSTKYLKESLPTQCPNTTSSVLSSNSDAELKRKFDKTAENCIICMEEKRNCILLPCHHVVGCESCMKKLEYCCVCRQKVDSCERIYFS